MPVNPKNYLLFSFTSTICPDRRIITEECRRCQGEKGKYFLERKKISLTLFVALCEGDSETARFAIEATTLVAMIVYALVAWGAIALVKIVLAPSLSGSRRITTTRNNHYS
jgi:hypothetical protein